MRIAFISTISGYAWGGSEELWYRVALAALGNGHDVYVSISESSESDPHMKTLAEHGAKLGFRPSYKPKNGYLSMAANFAAAKVARRTGRDYGDIGRFRADRVIVNLSPTYHLLGVPDLRRFLSKSGVRYGLISQGHNDEPFWSDEWRLIIRDCFLQADWIGFVSKANLESAERHLGTRLTDAFVVQNPANLRSYEYLAFPEPLSPLRFANVARFDPAQKGQDLLFEVLGSGEWPTRDWILSIAGSNHLQRLYFDDLAELYRIKGKVRLLGHVPDVQEIWRDHHILVLPSRFEGTPLSLIESMVCGRTAMVTDVAGNCEWIDRELGFIAEAATTKHIAAALEDVWQRREELRKLGELCHRRALEMVDQDMAGAILERLLT